MRVLGKDLTGKKVKMSTRHANKSRLLSTSKKVTSHLKIQENMSNIFCSDSGDKGNVHETLCQVKKKLENLYIILQNYNNREFQSIISNMYHNSSSINRRDPTLTEISNNSEYECKGKLEGKYTYDVYNDLQSIVGSYDPPEVFAIHSTCNRISRNSQFPIQIVQHPDDEEYSASEVKTCRMRNSNILKKVGISNTLRLTRHPNTNKKQVNNELLENHITTTIKNCSVSTNTENILKIDKSNSTEISRESNSDDKAVTALLRKTLSYENKELISKIESEESCNISQVENMCKQSESFDYSNWENVNTHFQPKSLDMITEESSGSSMDKRSNTSISRVSEECKDLLEQEIQSHDKNNSIESTISKNQTTVKQEVMINHITEKPHLHPIVKIKGNPATNYTEDISMITDCLDYQEVESIAKAHKLVIQSTDDDLKLQANLNSSTYTESDSDTSVNKLIDRLIESERKSKSARSLSGSKSRQDLAVDSLNNLIDSHNFLESTHFENEDCNTEKLNYLEIQQNVIKHNFDIDNQNRIKNEIYEPIENEVQSSPESMTTVINMYINHETLTPLPSQSVCNKDRREDEMIDKSTSCIATTNKSSQVSSDYIQSINSDSLLENENGNVNMSVNKNCINFLISNSTLQKNKNHQNKPTKKNEIIEDESTVDEKHFDDFCSNHYKLLTQEGQAEEEVSKQKSYGLIDTINNISSSNDIDLPAEISKSDNSKFKCNQFISCEELTKLFSVGLRSLEQNVETNYKNSGLNPFQRSSLKSNYDLNNSKQLKAKSYLNLASFEKTSPVQTHRRSKSYVTPRDISLNIKNNIEKTSSSESLVFSNKSSLKGFKSQTPREYMDDKRNKELEAKRENSFESLSNSSMSSSKSYHLLYPRASLTCKKEIKNNYSFIDFLNDDYSNINDMKIRSSMEASPISNKSVSKSCIPILKIRMEGTKKNVYDSYARSPLTMTAASCRTEEKLEQKHWNEIKNTSIHETTNENENLCLRDILELQYSGNSIKYTILIKLVSNSDHCTFIKLFNSKRISEQKNHCIVNTQNETNKDQDNVAYNENNQTINLPIMKNKDANPKNDEVVNINSLNSHTLQINNILSQSSFAKRSIKETEVLVKPTTADTSTSVSDLPEVSNEMNEVNEFKIFEVPEELTKEEYITVLKMINENPEFKQLSNMDKLCCKLQWDLHR